MTTQRSRQKFNHRFGFDLFKLTVALGERIFNSNLFAIRLSFIPFKFNTLSNIKQTVIRMFRHIFSFIQCMKMRSLEFGAWLHILCVCIGCLFIFYISCSTCHPLHMLLCNKQQIAIAWKYINEQENFKEFLVLCAQYERARWIKWENEGEQGRNVYMGYKERE